MIAEVSIRFVNIGIEISNLGKNFDVFGFKIAFYGITLATAILFGMLLTFRGARITGQNVDNYYDFAIWAVIFSIIGARIYYVIFSWDEYKHNLLSVFNLRQGGIAMYGSIIGGLIAAIVFTKIKKINILQMIDTIIPGLILGQVIGRWGNFFNREAYGGYTDSLLAMQIKLDEAGGVITEQIRNNIKIVDGIKYIQVHPTFLYESMWNLILLIIVLLCKKYKKFEGEIFAWYMIGYGIGRFIIEGLRTDQLLIPVINIAISQVVSVVIVIIGLVAVIRKRFMQDRKLEKAEVK